MTYGQGFNILRNENVTDLYLRQIAYFFAGSKGDCLAVRFADSNNTGLVVDSLYDGRDGSRLAGEQ